MGDTMLSVKTDYPWNIPLRQPPAQKPSNQPVALHKPPTKAAKPPKGSNANAAKGIPNRFCLSKDGVSFRPDSTGAWEYVCSPLQVVACTRSGSSEDWGRLLRITDRDGKIHEWAMPMAMLAADGAEYRRRLLSLGLEIAPGKKHKFTSISPPAAR